MRVAKTSETNPQLFPARSYLFVPADRPDRFSKALDSGADAVIVDLEDAVSHEQKEAARRNVAEWLSIEHPVHLRVNGSDTSWFQADLELCGHPGVLVVVGLPRHPAPPVQTSPAAHQASGPALHDSASRARLSSRISASPPFSML